MAASQESTVDTASVAVNATDTAALYQPFALGGRSGVAVVAGAVASYLSASESESEFPALSRHAPSTDTNEKEITGAVILLNDF